MAPYFVLFVSFVVRLLAPVLQSCRAVEADPAWLWVRVSSSENPHPLPPQLGEATGPSFDLGTRRPSPPRDDRTRHSQGFLPVSSGIADCTNFRENPQESAGMETLHADSNPFTGIQVSPYRNPHRRRDRFDRWCDGLVSGLKRAGHRYRGRRPARTCACTSVLLRGTPGARTPEFRSARCPRHATRRPPSPDWVCRLSVGRHSRGIWERCPRTGTGAPGPSRASAWWRVRSRRDRSGPRASRTDRGDEVG